MNSERGLTMVELMVSLVIVMVVIGAAATAYLKLLRTYRTQGRLAESYMANLTGLEILRYDIETAGFGLPIDLGTLSSYSEAADGSVPYNPSNLNDAPSSPPRPLAHANNAGAGSSDVLSIKSSSANIINNPAAKKWSMITNPGGTPAVKCWGGVTALDKVMDFATNDRFIVLNQNGQLQLPSGNWCCTFNASAPGTGYYSNASTIGDPGPTHVYYIYGLDSSLDTHNMPFNRVDYYLDKITADFPSNCAGSTYTLYRSTVDQKAGTLTKSPLVDCVRDFQVAFGVDPSGNGTASIQWQADMSQQNWMTNYNAGAQMTAAQIQTYLREVRVFVLYQEGLGDTSRSADFRFSGFLNLGDQDIANSLGGAAGFQQLSTSALAGSLKSFSPTGKDLQYRWKIVEMAVKPMNLMGLTAATLR